MPRTPRRRTPPDRSRPAPESEPVERMTSEEEKRQLILAHASSRESRPGLGFGAYIGIAASCLVILSGWWMTLDRNLRTDLPFTASTGYDQLKATIDAFQQRLQKQTTNANATNQPTSQPTDQQNQFRLRLLENVVSNVRQQTANTSTSSVSPTK